MKKWKESVNFWALGERQNIISIICTGESQDNSKPEMYTIFID